MGSCLVLEAVGRASSGGVAEVAMEKFFPMMQA